MTAPLSYNLRSWGDAAHAPALLLHGFTAHGGGWAEAAERFASAGYRVLAPDLLGHGRSPAPPDPARYAMARAADDLAALLDAAAREPVHLLGYSMGGRLALYVALAFPARLRSLTLVSAAPGLATAHERAERRDRDNALADRIEREGIAAFVDYWASLPLWKSQARNLSPARRQQLRALRLQNRPRGLANSLRGMGHGVQPNLFPRLPALRVPTLLLVGAEDEKFVAVNRRMAQQIPDARLVIVKEAGHAVHLERPRAFSRATLNFWRTRAPTRSPESGQTARPRGYAGRTPRAATPN